MIYINIGFILNKNTLCFKKYIIFFILVLESNGFNLLRDKYLQWKVGLLLSILVSSSGRKVEQRVVEW